MSLKKDIWELIEKEIPDASDTIGWGSMDSLCDDLIDLVKECNHDWIDIFDGKKKLCTMCEKEDWQ